MNSRITIARGEQEILDCYPVMAELRPHIRPEEFLPMVKRLIEINGFQLAYLTDGEIKAVAGFRIADGWPEASILKLKTSWRRAASGRKVTRRVV